MSGIRHLVLTCGIGEHRPPAIVDNRGSPRFPLGPRIASIVVHVAPSDVVAQGWEQDDVANGSGAGEHHHESVDADSDPAGRWHAVFERA